MPIDPGKVVTLAFELRDTKDEMTHGRVHGDFGVHTRQMGSDPN